jgi:hypothetical protein
MDLEPRKWLFVGDPSARAAANFCVDGCRGCATASERAWWRICPTLLPDKQTAPSLSNPDRIAYVERLGILVLTRSNQLRF